MLSLFFPPFFANVQANVTYGMYYYITTEFDHAKYDSRLAAYRGVMFREVKFSRYVIVHAICHVSLNVHIKRKKKKENIESLGRLWLNSSH